MKKRQKRRLALLAFLLVLLAAMGLWYWNFSATKSLALNVTTPSVGHLSAPKFLFAFAGTTANHLAAPVGVLADNGYVYVTDTSGLVFQFTQDGKFVRTFGKGVLSDPLYIAKDPKDGLLYVTDRGKRGMFKFTVNGQYVGEFNPNLPKAQLPTFNTHGVQWVPVALAFAPDGTMYVSETLNGQRMLIFAPDGTFRKSVGHTGIASNASDLPGTFQFVNSIKVHGNEVWVSDSNNGRIEIFGLDGTYKALLAIGGLPRGFAFLPKNAGASSVATGDVYVVVDVLGNAADVYSTAGASSITFGERGTQDGQFNLPNDVSPGNNGVIFITDNKNTRVQAWGWPLAISPVARLIPQQPAWLLVLLPLLILPVFFRKKKFYATADFIEAMAAADAISELNFKRNAWYLTQADYDRVKHLGVGEVKLAEALNPDEFSDTDARALAARYEFDYDTAALLSSARRMKALCTQNADLRKTAVMLEIDVMNAVEYRKRFEPKKK